MLGTPIPEQIGSKLTWPRRTSWSNARALFLDVSARRERHVSALRRKRPAAPGREPGNAGARFPQR